MNFEERAEQILNDLKEANRLIEAMEQKMLEFETKLLVAEIYEEIG